MFNSFSFSDEIDFWGINFSTDEKLLAIAFTNGRIKIYNLNSSCIIFNTHFPITSLRGFRFSNLLEKKFPDKYFLCFHGISSAKKGSVYYTLTFNKRSLREKPKIHMEFKDSTTIRMNFTKVSKSFQIQIGPKIKNYVFASISNTKCDSIGLYLDQRGSKAEVIFEIGKTVQRCISNIIYTPDMKLVAAGFDDNTIKFWYPFDRRYISSFNCRFLPKCLSFSPNGNYFAVTNCSNFSELAIFKSPILPLSVLSRHTSLSHQHNFSEDLLPASLNDQIDSDNLYQQIALVKRTLFIPLKIPANSDAETKEKIHREQLVTQKNPNPFAEILAGTIAEAQNDLDRAIVFYANASKKNIGSGWLNVIRLSKNITHSSETIAFYHQNLGLDPDQIEILLSGFSERIKISKSLQSTAEKVLLKDVEKLITSIALKEQGMIIPEYYFQKEIFWFFLSDFVLSLTQLPHPQKLDPVLEQIKLLIDRLPKKFGLIFFNRLLTMSVTQNNSFIWLILMCFYKHENLFQRDKLSVLYCLMMSYNPPHPLVKTELERIKPSAKHTENIRETQRLFNNIKPAKKILIKKIFFDSDISIRHLLTKSNMQIQIIQLQFRYCTFSEIAIKTLAEFLLQLDELKIIELAHCNITFAFFRILFNTACKNPHLEKFNLYANNIYLQNSFADSYLEPICQGLLDRQKKGPFLLDLTRNYLPQNACNKLSKYPNVELGNDSFRQHYLPSRIIKTGMTNEDYSIIYLTRNKQSRDPEHAMLLIEGVRSFCQNFIIKYDFRPNLTGPYGTVYITEFDPSVTQRQLIHYYGLCFLVPSEIAERLQANILKDKDKEKKIVYSRIGGSKLSSKGYNCYTWAKSKLLELPQKYFPNLVKGDFMPIPSLKLTKNGEL